MVHTINTKEHFFDAITLMKITHNCTFPELANNNKKKITKVCMYRNHFRLCRYSQRMTWKQTKTKEENKRNKHTNNSFLFL